MSAKCLRVGFIGTGGIARHHATLLKEMEDVVVVAGADVSDAARAKFAEAVGIEAMYENWRDMLATEKLDAVSVCTPNGLHMQPTIDALEAGCHVLVEKPLACNAREGEAMVAAAEKAGKQFVIGFQWRYDPKVQMLKRAADAGRFGKIVFMRCQALRRRGIPNWGVFGRKDLQGGGGLIDIGVHVMEMAHYVMGAPEPVAASGMVYTYLGNKPSEVVSMWPNWDHETYTVEDLAIGQIRFANGALMQVEAGFVAHCPDKFTFNFLGEKGGASLEPLACHWDDAGTMVNVTPDWLPKDDKFRTKMRKFVDTALHGAPTESPATDGLMLQRMIDALYASAENGGAEVTI